MKERKISVPLLFSHHFYHIVLKRREYAKYKTLSTFIEDQLLDKFEKDFENIKK